MREWQSADANWVTADGINYAPAIRHWESIIGRSAPGRLDREERLQPAFAEWMLGFPENWTDGESRVARLRMLGNAVQVQCGEVVGRMLAKI